MVFAQVFVALFLGYLGLGAVFALWFVLRGAERIDPTMHGASWQVRALLFPGATALFPLLWLKWNRAGREKRQANASSDH